MHIQTLLLCLITTFTVAAATISEEAKALNKKAFKLYKAELYDSAATLFEEAAQRAPDWDVPHYNALCMYSLMYEEAITSKRNFERVLCEERFFEPAYAHLQKALDLNPARIDKLSTDIDLKGITTDFHYNIRFLKFDIRKTEGLKAVVGNVLWWGPSPGVYGPTYFIDFHSDGTYDGWHADYFDGDYKRVPNSGTWIIDGTNIILNGSTIRTLRNDGNLYNKNGEIVGYHEQDACGA